MRIRTRLLLVISLFTLLAALAIDLTASILMQRAVFDRAVDRLSRECSLLAGELESHWPDGPAEADAWADRTGERLDLRVTLIDTAGVVLGDSDVPASAVPSLENHGHRPEILEASREGAGSFSRVSHSIDRELEYFARRVGSPDRPLGYVRLSAPTEELRAASRGYRLTLALVSVTALLLLALLATFSAQRIYRPLESIARAADRVASGETLVPIEPVTSDEIGEIAASVDRMRRTLIEQIAKTESERRLLASILSGLREGILVVNMERRLLLLNDSLRRIFGIPRDLPEGTPMIQIAWDHTIVEAFDEALAGRTDIRRRIAVGGGRAFELTVVPFSDATGRQVGAIGLFFDITRMEALERIRRDFVADLSHELRTPLASVKAALETLIGGAREDPEEAGRFLGILSNNAARMEAILNDLTDLSLIETGAVSLSLVRLDLAAAVRDATAAVTARAVARGVAIDCRIEPGLTLHADRRRLDQILVNLLDNAVKFNRPQGRVTVAATAEEGSIVLTIDDTGDGIPPDALQRVFNRFFRVDRSRSQEVPGTGLGLAIVMHLVRLHGGDIRAENRNEGGTRFVVRLPIASPSGDEEYSTAGHRPR